MQGKLRLSNQGVVLAELLQMAWALLPSIGEQQCFTAKFEQVVSIDLYCHQLEGIAGQ